MELFKYQEEHANNLVRILNAKNVALDASDTGTGKTYTSVHVCKQMNLNPIIICPKSVKSNWSKVCENFGVKPLLIVNYELIQRTKYNFNGKHVKCKYIDFTDNKKNYMFKLPKSSIFIFDEVHKCSDLSTHNSKLLLAAKSHTELFDSKLLILSATIADLPTKFYPFYFILDFIDKEYLNKQKITLLQYMNIMDKWINRDPNPMNRIHHMLYPDRASRMRISVLGDLFPPSQIVAMPYSMGLKREKEIEFEYRELAKYIDKIKEQSKKDKGGILTRILRAQQKIELLKIPTFVELAKDFESNGFSIVIFVNFTQTLETLAKMLNATSMVYGQQSTEERDKAINDFQSNKTKYIICNIKAGGLGISLHDIHGEHPRVSLISPTWSSIDLQQALGRIYRAGGKTKSLQRIIYAANTVEEKIADKLKEKLRALNSINNGDLDLTNIEFSTEYNKF